MARRTPPETRARGAHFLASDGTAVARLVAAAALRPAEHVLDVGAGKGAIARLLCDAVGASGSVVAIEKDPELADHLASLGRANLDVRRGDALAVRLPARIDAVVANPPYRILPALLRRLLAHGFGRAVLVMPKELAQRLTAKVGDEAYGKLTVQVGVAATSRVLFPLRRSDFDPPPEVESRVVSVVPKAPEPIDAGILDAVLDAAWASRLRTLRHSLAPLAQELGVPPQAVTDAQAAVDAGARTAAEVAPWEYAVIARTLAARRA